jgi:hypothetical protein
MTSIKLNQEDSRVSTIRMPEETDHHGRLITVHHLLGHAKITMTARCAHSQNSARIEAVARLENFPASQSVSNRSPDLIHGNLRMNLSRCSRVR